VAAVAATSEAIDQALSLIAIDYEVLAHVIDVDEAMKPDAPLLFPDLIGADRHHRARRQRAGQRGSTDGHELLHCHRREHRPQREAAACQGRHGNHGHQPVGYRDGPVSFPGERRDNQRPRG
jgi:CO/xanthine dehydrogenase Mo-binding subunit